MSLSLQFPLLRIKLLPSLGVLFFILEGSSKVKPVFTWLSYELAINLFIVLLVNFLRIPFKLICTFAMLRANGEEEVERCTFLCTKLDEYLFPVCGSSSGCKMQLLFITLYPCQHCPSNHHRIIISLCALGASLRRKNSCCWQDADKDDDKTTVVVKRRRR